MGQMVQAKQFISGLCSDLKAKVVYRDGEKLRGAIGESVVRRS